MKTGPFHLGWGMLPVLVAPWLIPPQNGPSPSLVSVLFSLGCLGLLLCCAVWRLQRPSEGNLDALPASAWLAAALVSSVIGLLQYFGVALDAFRSSVDVGEAYGNLRQRNQFATLTNIGLMTLLWWGGQPALNRPHCLRPWLLQVMAVLFAVANAASVSRTGLVQLLLTAALALYWKPKDQCTRRILIAALLGYALASLFLPLLSGSDTVSIIGRFQSPGEVCTSRLTLWSNVLQLIGQKPWLGWGWGELDYAHFMNVYQGPRFCELLDNAHNLPLHLAVELGVPVALLVCGASIGLILYERPWREANSNRQLAWGILILILLHSMLEYPLWYGPFQLALVMCVGLLLWPRIGKTLEGRSSQSQRIAKIGALLGGLCLVGVSMYAAWEYHRISQIYLPPEQRAEAYRENTLEKIRGSWLFADQVRFAEYTLTSMTIENAAHLHELGLKLLHFSPESRVVEKLIESAVVLERDEEARFYLSRYKAAYPQDYARWSARHRYEQTLQ